MLFLAKHCAISAVIDRAATLWIALKNTHYGDPGGTRTPYLQIRNLSLYPDELRDHLIFMPYFATKDQSLRLLARLVLRAGLYAHP